MISSAVASRYAHALADVVTSPSSEVGPQKVVADLRSFESLLRSSVELQNALSSPAVPTARKRTVSARIAGQLALSRVSQNFLFVLIDHRRIGYLSAIIDAFEETLDERLGYARAQVTSARTLDQPQQSAIVGELEQLAGKKLRPRFSVDESLLGGVIARVGSTVFDGSVRGQLEALGRRLTAQ